MTDHCMRRLVRLLGISRININFTTDYLMNKYNICQRTVERDMAVLSEAGFSFSYIKGDRTWSKML